MEAHLSELVDALAQAGGSCTIRGIPPPRVLALKLLGQPVQLPQVLCQNRVLSHTGRPGSDKSKMP